jgi:hypothetical protein
MNKEGKCRFLGFRWNWSDENRAAVCCSETRSTSPLKHFQEGAFREEASGCSSWVSYSAICCPCCDNYCFDYCTLLMCNEWNKITECIHSPATRIKVYYYYKRLAGTQKSLATYVANSSQHESHFANPSLSLTKKIIGIKVFLSKQWKWQGQFL